MDPATGNKLELFIDWYHKTRCATLRLLRSMPAEDLLWQPGSRIPSAHALLSEIVAWEELHIHRRLRGKAMLEDDFLRDHKSLSGPELHALLTSMKRSTDRFLRRVLRGEQVARSSNLFSLLEKLIAQETQQTGKILFLQMLREAPRSEKIEPHSATISVRQESLKVKAKGASL